ncbi:MAG: YdcF family protein [Flavipsychrobacter sp.]|nr:YdcF family protein [Flavipsychrobacter sp.]
MLTALLVVLTTACITPRKGPTRVYAEAISNNMTFDAIIVPGIPFNNGSWDSVMKARLLWTWVLYKNGVAKNVIFSGDAVYSPYPEAKIMGLYAQKLGIPKEHIFYDTQARHSTENVYYSYLLAKKQGFKTLALATDPFQSSMLKGFTKRRFETPIYHLPFITDTLGAYNHLNPVLDKKEYEPVKKKNFISITEIEGIFRRMGGTLGWQIDWDKHDGKKLERL